ncbi:MAG: hypothetical protein GSR72_01060 [Desulfurococcales archaeon]|nr:hypothetical protein [Desulfurococcales archaeon]
MAVQVRSPRRYTTPCPYFRRGELEELRRHKACGRPFRYFPGGLNTVLDLSEDGFLSRLFHVYSDGLILSSLSLKGLVDGLYSIEYGPRYYHRNLNYYTEVSRVEKCTYPGYEFLDKTSIFYLSMQKLMVRQSRDGPELCNTNNTISPLGENKTLSIGLVHAQVISEEQGKVPAPEFVDKALQPELTLVTATMGVVGFQEDSLTLDKIMVNAIHPDPGYALERPMPHIAFIEWNRQTRERTLTLIPLYTYTVEYSYGLILSSLLLLSKHREETPINIYTIGSVRKLYKKMAKILDKLGLEKPEGGAPGLLELFNNAVSIEDDKASLGSPCGVECLGGNPTFPGLKIFLDPLEKGTGFVL